MTGGEVVPGGCRWCGFGERVHMSRWHPEVGQHVYEPPTDAQRLGRMRARQKHRAAASRIRQVGA